MSSPPSEQNSGSAAPSRVIGAAGALAVVVGSMLGIGIFLTPSQVAAHLPSPTAYLLAWLFGGLIAFAGAAAYAELGTRFPRAGGDYVFLREAFGDSISFAAGWVLFIGVFTGSVATMAVPLVQFQLPILLAPLIEIDPHQVLLSFPLMEITVARAIGALLIVLLTALNILGTRLSAGAQIILTGLPVLLLAIGALWIFGTFEPIEPIRPPAEEGFSLVGFGRAVLAIYFAYAGWNAIAYVGGELKNPGKNVPLSLLGGTVLITALYLLLAGSFLYVLGVEGLQSAFEAGTATANAVGDASTAYLITALIAVALLGSLNGTILAGGRVGWAMARQGAISPTVGALHHRFKTPHRALLLQGGLAIFFVFTGTFEILLELTSIAMLLMGALTMLALFRIRRRDGDQAPYKATLYPLTPIFFLLVSLIVIGSGIYRALFDDDGRTLDSLYPLLGLAIFAATWLLRGLFNRRAATLKK